MSNEVPLPRFTIEELLREAVEAAPTSAFTTREFAKLWGYRPQGSARRRMDTLMEKGWKFIATRKDIVNRAGVLTSVSAYIAVPPAEGDGGVKEDRDE